MAHSSDPSIGQALEQAIFDNPDDVSAYAVYADWLQEQGDPLGEFISVQLMLEEDGRAAADRKALQEREKELLQKHREAWLGELAPFFAQQKSNEDYFYYGHHCQFRRGFPYLIRVNVYNSDFAYCLAHAPQAKSIQQMILVDGSGYDDEFDQAPPGYDKIPQGEIPQYYYLKQAPFLQNLRVFQIGEDYGDDQYGTSCHTNGEGVVDLLKYMPRLEELRLMAHQIDAPAIFRMSHLTNLRLLEIDHVYNYPLDVLAGNPAFHNLTHLYLHPHALEPGEVQAYIRLEHIEALVRSPHLQKLTHLRLCLTDAGDEGIREIADSGALKRLKMLNLSHGCVTDEGARILAASPDVKNLEHLNLNYNALTGAGVKVLESLGIAFSAEQQYDPANIHDHQEFLYAGDWE